MPLGDPHSVDIGQLTVIVVKGYVLLSLLCCAVRKILLILVVCARLSCPAPFTTPLQPAQLHALDSAAKHLQSRGCRVIEATFPLLAGYVQLSCHLLQRVLTVWCAR